MIHFTLFDLFSAKRLKPLKVDMNNTDRLLMIKSSELNKLPKAVGPTSKLLRSQSERYGRKSPTNPTQTCNNQGPKDLLPKFWCQKTHNPSPKVPHLCADRSELFWEPKLNLHISHMCACKSIVIIHLQISI